MSEQGPEKPERQVGSKKRLHEVAIAGLLSGRRIEDVAQSIGINERTLQRWLNQPTFKRRLAKAKSSVLSEAVANITGSLSKAINTLVKNLDSMDEKVANQAADKLLGHATKLGDIVDLENRLIEIEAKLKKNETPLPHDDLETPE